MLLGSIVAFACLALTGVSANPVAVEERNYHPPQVHCEGGSYPWNGKCVCPHEKKEWDWDKHQCKKPCLPKPHCKKDEKPYCLKSKHEWCGWDKHRHECDDDHHNIVFCCKDKDLKDRIKDHYPDHDPPHHCNDKENYRWHPEHKKCECPHGQYWNEHEHKCKWKPLPKPYCPGHQKPRCGEKRKKHCDYDDRNDYCRDDGRHKTWCCDDKDLNYWLDRLFYD